MSESRREKFLHRISTVGGGTREAIQIALGSIVYDLRDQVERGMFGEEEMDAVISFHDRAEEFWRRTTATNPPMDPMLIVAGLRRLRGDCNGPLLGFGVRIDQTIKMAESFAFTRKRD